MLALSQARDLAVKSVRQVQKRYKAQYDKSATPSEVKVGDWVFVHFPQDEMGRMRKYHGMGLIEYVLSKGLM